jgi:hypothetical protein
MFTAVKNHRYEDGKEADCCMNGFSISIQTTEGREIGFGLAIKCICSSNNNAEAHGTSQVHEPNQKIDKNVEV